MPSDFSSFPAFSGFSRASRSWFLSAFPSGPTSVQERAWAAIGRGENALVVAPTGSGKTLAAFFSAIDRLMRRSAEDREAKGVRVLYVSPLKALAADVERNLRRPLAGVERAARGLRESGELDDRGESAEPACELGVAEGPGLVREPGEPGESGGEFGIGAAAAPVSGNTRTNPVEETRAIDAALQGPRTSVGMRTGDTPAKERRRLRVNPPDILITTPESLYLMLTSEARKTLGAVSTVIVDEIHSLAGSKRGTHLALSLERLDGLLEEPAQRIGLSATVSPARTVADFLGGSRPVTIVEADSAASPDVAVSVPVADMAAIPPVSVAGQMVVSMWPHIERAILDHVLRHRTTVVFVNSRGACERLTAHLNEEYANRFGGAEGSEAAADGFAGSVAAVGSVESVEAHRQTRGRPGAGRKGLPAGAGAHRQSWGSGDSNYSTPSPEAPVIAKAHHGSVSKEQRLAVENELKSGSLRCVVATASLELGIDMGSIDLVLQVAPPPSVASGLQRIGRANHAVGGRSRGAIYPVERTHLVDAAVAAEGMRTGAIEETELVANALDVLAQQTVAAVSVEETPADRWFETVRRAAPYAALPRESFDSVLELLSGAYASADLADFSPRIVWDREAGVLRARPGAQRLAVSFSGTIPDRGMFPVVLPEGAEEAGRRRVGELDEEMVYESRVGDVVTLGTSSWQIREITGDRVIVDHVSGRSSRLPFWRGEGPGRPASAGAAKGAFLREAEASLELASGPEAAGGRRPAANPESSAGVRSEPHVSASFLSRLESAGLDENARENLVSLLLEQKAATGAIPSDETLVLERCRDENGSWRFVLHSPMGRRVHEPWAMAIRERIRRVAKIEPQVFASDDGVAFQLPATIGRPPGAELVVFDAEELRRLVTSRIGGTALFAARFRECAARALLTPSSRPGRRTPLWLQRLRAGQLLEASRQFRNFPVSVEAARECLQDVYDLPALAGLMERIEARFVRIVEAETASPSPFARPLLFGYTGAFLYQEDLPRAERRAHLLSLDPEAIASLVGDGGVGQVLDESVLAEVEAELQRLAPGRRVRRDAEAVADLLRRLGPLTLEGVAARSVGACDDAPPAQEKGDSAAREDAADAADSSQADEKQPRQESESRFPRVGEGSAWDGQEEAAASEAVRSLLEELAQSRRVVSVRLGGRECWAGAEDAPALRLALGVDVPEWAAEPGGLPRTSAVSRSPLEDLLLRCARTRARITAADAATEFGIGRATAAEALESLAESGSLMRIDDAHWMEASVFARVRNRSLARARAAIEPVRPAALHRLVLERAGIDRPGRGIDALAEAISLMEGVWLPASLWESVVFPARVADYSPGMLDELILSGDVLWQARSGGESGRASSEASRTGKESGRLANDASQTGGAPVGEIAFFPTDSPLAPVAGAAVSADDVGWEDLWKLAREGAATALSFEPVRACLQPRTAAPKKRRVTSRRSRRYAAFAAARALSTEAQGIDSGGPAQGTQPGNSQLRQPSPGSGAAAGAERLEAAMLQTTWRRLSPPRVSAEEAAVAMVESLLDRYGVVSRDIALAAGVPGGMASLTPVLRRMEDAGAVLRGTFVRGLGPVQYAERGTLDALRSFADSPSDADVRAVVEGDSEPAAAVLDLRDPACLMGRGVPWPDPALPSQIGERLAAAPSVGLPDPSRRPGSAVVLVDGEPALYAPENMKALVSYTPETAAFRSALRALTESLRRAAARDPGIAARKRTVVESVNGVSALERAMGDALAEAGLARDPRGMRFAVGP
ncbi:DEAD/DEAH box helicase [Peptidiphaga gingivicola]|uniref:DEAD/DEAH box helicase n=1 Tax=Peptidiphaga gingivicola TaxID=2741497 RepID=A0A179B5E3_9ACTO|nr:DEAD/DEAH box helicase [Peptidiphaga gingivicola]OAP86908.1 DEAD/DEAH box helicase [Peptidiphaga gingivicola]